MMGSKAYICAVLGCPVERGFVCARACVVARVFYKVGRVFYKRSTILFLKSCIKNMYQRYVHMNVRYKNKTLWLLNCKPLAAWRYKNDHLRVSLCFPCSSNQCSQCPRQQCHQSRKWGHVSPFRYHKLPGEFQWKSRT